MAHDLDYQTRIIMNMDYSKEIARARADAAAQNSGVSATGSPAANVWSGAGTSSPAYATATSYTATPANQVLNTAATTTTAATAPATKPSLWQRIKSFFGL